MDPVATLHAFIDACAGDDRIEALECLDALSAWIGKGGFIATLGQLRLEQVGTDEES